MAMMLKRDKEPSLGHNPSMIPRITKNTIQQCATRCNTLRDYFCEGLGGPTLLGFSSCPTLALSSIRLASVILANVALAIAVTSPMSTRRHRCSSNTRLPQGRTRPHGRGHLPQTPTPQTPSLPWKPRARHRILTGAKPTQIPCPRSSARPREKHVPFQETDVTPRRDNETPEPGSQSSRP